MFTTWGFPRPASVRAVIALVLILGAAACGADDASFVSPLDESRLQALQLGPADFDLIEGESLPLTLTQGGLPVSRARIAWTVAPESAGTIDAQGVLTAHAPAGLTVRATVGALRASIQGTIHGQPADLIPLTAELQAGYVGSAFEDSVTVRVTSSDGAPVPGVEVAFAAGPESGSVSHDVRTTDDEGMARVAWTLGTTPGQQSATASVAGLSTVTFEAAAQPDVHSAQPELLSGNDQEAEAGEVLPEPLVLRVQDAYGNPVEALGVQWIFSSGVGAGTEAFNAGEAAATAVTHTNSEGLTSVRWRLGTESGDQSVTVALLIAGDASPVAPSWSWRNWFRSRSRAGVPKYISVTPSTVGVEAGSSVQLSASVTDRYRNPVDTATVRWSMEDPSIASLLAPGLVRGNVPGQTRAVARSGSLSASALVNVNAVAPAPPAQLRLTSGNGQSGVVGSELGEMVVVRLLDASGTGVPGESIEWSVARGGGSFRLVDAMTNGDGFAKVYWTLGEKVEANALRAAHGELSVSINANATVGPVAVVNVSPSALSMDVGESGSLTATLEDAFGNPIAATGVAWSSSDASVAGVGNDGTVSAIAAGSANVSATKNGVSAAATVTVDAPAPPPAPPEPTVVSASPSSGPTTGGTRVTILGTDFQAGAKVEIGGSYATQVVFNSASSLTVTSPVGRAGSRAIIVENPDGQKGVLVGAFQYVAPAPAAPTIASVSPDSGPTTGGTAITVTGTGFVSGATVKVGGQPATGVVFNSSTQLTAVTAAVAAGVRNVLVTNPDGQFARLQSSFTFVAPAPPAATAPTVASVSPNSGPTAGGTQISISGSGFVSGATVSVGGVAASQVVFHSSGSLSAVAPSGSAGARSVAVANPDGQSGMLAGAFTYVAPSAPTGAAPTIASISREVGSTAGGTEVTLTGGNFAAGAAVRFGGVSGNVVSLNANEIKVRVPAHGTGWVDVRVVNPDQQSAELNQAFEYLPAPTTIHVSHDFEDGTVGPFHGSGAVSVGNWGSGMSMSGSRSSKAVLPVGHTGGGALHYTYSPGQPANSSTGVYQRWYVRLDQNTINAVRSGQIKLLLNRSGGNPPSWLHVGIGGHFPANRDNIGTLKDYNTGLVDGGQSDSYFKVVADQWIEIQTWYHRSGGVGRARMWIDGKSVLDHTDGMFGTDDLSKIMRWQFGLGFTQSTTGSGSLTVLVDDAVAANGFIDPVR